MGAFSRISLILLAILMGMGILGWTVLFKTSPGKTFVKMQVISVLESVIDERLQSTLSIGELTGDLPGEIVLVDLVLSNEGEAWFQAKEIRVNWSPYRALWRNYEIETLGIVEGQLLRPPPTSEKNEDAEPFEVFDLLDLALPTLTVRGISVEDFRLAPEVLGTERFFSASGNFSTGGNQISSDLELTTNDDSDSLLSLVRADSADIVVDVSLKSSPEGIVSQLVGESSGISLRLQGTGPGSDWLGKLSFDSGNWGKGEFCLQADLSRQSAAEFEGEYSPGPSVPEGLRDAMGKDLKLALGIKRTRTHLDVELSNLSGAFGVVNGKISDIVLPRPGFSAAFSLEMDLAPAFVAEQSLSFLAGKSQLTGKINGLANELSGAVEMRRDRLKVAVRNASFSPDAGLRATLNMVADGLPFLPTNLVGVLPDGFIVDGEIALKNGIVSVSALSAELGEETGKHISASGSGSVDLSTDSIRYTGGAVANGQFMSGLSQTLETNGPLSLELEINGSLSSFTADARANYSRSKVAGVDTGAGRVTAQLASLPYNPQGSVKITSLADQYEGQFNLATKRLTFVDISDLEARFEDSALMGDVTYAFEPRQLTTDLYLDLEYKPEAGGATSAKATSSLALSVDAKQNIEGVFDVG